MDLDTGFIYIGHITDFFHLCNTTAVSKIRLDHLNGLFIQHFLKLPSAVNPLTAGYWNSRLLMHISKCILVRDYRLLIIENAIFLCHISKLDC